MSGSVIRANGWQLDIEEERYLAVSPNGEVVTLYQTDSQAKNEDDNIIKMNERAGFENILCIQYSAVTPGLTAVGQLDGSCLIFDIRDSSISPVVLKPKQARSCNSMTFNENGLIALGYDRGRQDHSIQVWDVSSLTKGDYTGKSSKVFSYVPNESISSLSFCATEPRNFLAGSYKLLREFDIRSNQPVYQLATRCTLNIAVNPFDPNIFASNSEDGSLAIWDRRKLTDVSQMNRNHSNTSILSEGPVLMFNKLLNDYQRRTGGSPYRFSSMQQGEISALFDGDLVRRWQIGMVPPLESELEQYDSMIEQGKLENPNFISRIARPRGTMFISKVTDVKTKYERVISFDYAPSTKWEHGIDLVCMRQSGSIYKMRVRESQTGITFNSYNDITFTGPSGTSTKYVKDEVKNDLIIREDNSNNNNNKNLIDDLRDGVSDMSVSKESESDDANIFVAESESICLTSDALLENDICATIRRRANLGYSTNSKNNMEILESFKTFETQMHLRNTWKWIDISHDLISTGKMTYGDFDFGYLGVLGIWNLEENFAIYNRYSGFKSITKKDIMNAAKSIMERRANEINLLAKPVIGFKGKSNKEIQRKLAMYVIGWDFGARELEEKYISLVASGNFERAAGWAVFHGDVARAITILGESSNESYRIMSTAIAAYSAFKDSQLNNTWKDQCRQLASDLEDPYLRVIFAYIADGNWWDVLDESALPLRERLGVALRFLPDNELDVYLNRLADFVIDRGEIEGIILTGITEKGIDLLQYFVDRSNDTQSACLIASFACPKYFKDDRVDSWVESYRVLLNSWGLFSVRAKFDVSRTNLSKRMNGEIRTNTVPRQVYLQCSNCHKSISDDREKSTSSNVSTSKNGNISGRENNKRSRSKNTCPHCGYPLPRCAICLITQGVPVPKELMHVDSENRIENEIKPSMDRQNNITIDGGATNMNKTNIDMEGNLNMGMNKNSDRLNRNTDTKENNNVDDSVRQLSGESQFKEWFSFCLSCNHSMHAGHAEEWFSKHYVCPVPDCDCKCNNK